LNNGNYARELLQMSGVAKTEGNQAGWGEKGKELKEMKSAR
jgi:hypothetical protein